MALFCFCEAPNTLVTFSFTETCGRSRLWGQIPLCWDWEWKGHGFSCLSHSSLVRESRLDCFLIYSWSMYLLTLGLDLERQGRIILRGCVFFPLLLISQSVLSYCFLSSCNLSSFWSADGTLSWFSVLLSVNS